MVQFEWDPDKAESNNAKHGVSFPEAATVLVAKGGIMKDEERTGGDDDMRAEYDFASMSGGVQGKYVDRFKDGTNLVRLEPDVAAVFKDESSVNSALRTLIDVAKNRVPVDE